MSAWGGSGGRGRERLRWAEGAKLRGGTGKRDSLKGDKLVDCVDSHCLFQSVGELMAFIGMVQSNSPLLSLALPFPRCTDIN